MDSVAQVAWSADGSLVATATAARATAGQALTVHPPPTTSPPRPPLTPLPFVASATTPAPNCTAAVRLWA